MPELRLKGEPRELPFWGLRTLSFNDVDVGCPPVFPVDIGLARFIAELVGAPVGSSPLEPRLEPEHKPSEPDVRLPVMPPDEARFDTGGAGRYVRRARVVHVRVEDAWVVIIVCNGNGDGLIGRAGLRAAEADLRAGWVELGTAYCHGKVEGNNLLQDEVSS